VFNLQAVLPLPKVLPRNESSQREWKRRKSANLTDTPEEKKKKSAVLKRNRKNKKSLGNKNPRYERQ
jgi:NADH:ubiquinone oxidoreductase subunit